MSTLIRSIDVTPVLHAIDRAELRLQSGSIRAVDELHNIIRAKHEYDAAAARASAESAAERNGQEQFLTAIPSGNGSLMR